MKNILFFSVFIGLVFCLHEDLFGQTNRYLQIDLNAGYSEPVQAFRQQHMFSGRGMSGGGGFDYFFGKLGIGFSGGFFNNNSGNNFSAYLEHKYFEKVEPASFDQWKTRYIVFGPSFKLGLKRFEFDIFVKGGGAQIIVPDLLFSKRFFNQTYEIYRFSGSSDDWQFAWSAGARLIFKCNHWLGIQTKADYFTTSYLSSVAYDNTFRDAIDGNRNGVLEDSEYFESQKVSNKGNSSLNVLNLSLGLIVQLGKKVEKKPEKMLPEVPESPAINDELVGIESQNVPAVKEEIQNTPIDEIRDTTENQEANIPIVNAQEKQENKNIPVDIVVEEKIEIPVTTYDAPEAEYDAEAAEFLYKAGESYFATNDFEDALPCFNKLKADPKYPRAKYMFALALCAMGNCAEAKKEYKEFAKTYKETDSRTLEIIFASHFERCSISGKLNKSDSDRKETASPAENQPEEYKIQFIAMRKPNAAFPRLTNVGVISTEFFPNKSVYRYTLGAYQDIKSAAADVYKVRKMGFRDAFVAVYKNGKRVNTLYHAR